MTTMRMMNHGKIALSICGFVWKWSIHVYTVSPKKTAGGFLNGWYPKAIIPNFETPIVINAGCSSKDEHQGVQGTPRNRLGPVKGALCGNPMQRIGEHVYQALKVLTQIWYMCYHVLKLWSNQWSV
jgi:hypothetical protein